MAAERTNAPSRDPRVEARDQWHGGVRIITLDGPSGAGKSTLGAALAEELGWTFLDSGLAYRGVAATAIKRGVALADTRTLSCIARELQLKVEGRTVNVAGIAASRLKDGATTEYASTIAARPEPRRVLTRRMQEMIVGRECVVAGRDAGTEIVPNARLRVFLSASLSIRGERRAAQSADGLLETTAALDRRDRRDRDRGVAPLQPSPGAVILDTSDQIPAETLETLWQLASQRRLITAPTPQ